MARIETFHNPPLFFYKEEKGKGKRKRQKRNVSGFFFIFFVPSEFFFGTGNCLPFLSLPDLLLAIPMVGIQSLLLSRVQWRWLLPLLALINIGVAELVDVVVLVSQPEEI